MKSIIVGTVLKFIDCVSKLFFLSQSELTSRTDGLQKSDTSWRSPSFWNIWTLSGLVLHTTFHVLYVSQNDFINLRPKLVTVFIDMYNKYCGLLLNATLVVFGYYQQDNVTIIVRLFNEVEDIFLKELRIKINNLNTLRFVCIQVFLLLGALGYVEYNNCLMYIAPTTMVTLDKFCIILCIIPMLTTAIIECRLFTYFLLIRERLRIINTVIDSYKNNLHSYAQIEGHKINVEKINGIRKKMFFITELVGSKKINDQVKKTDNSRHVNFSVQTKSAFLQFWNFIKNLLNIHKYKMFDDDFKVSKENSQFHANRLDSMKVIYLKLCEITDLVSTAYGTQLIMIISVQFVTMTTILYYTTMKIIRALTSHGVGLSDDKTEILSSGLWILIYLYKLYSICFCIYITNEEGKKIGYHLHIFALNSKQNDLKLKVKFFILQILQSRLRFTPFGLFDIDLTLFGMICGAVITYILILIQFDIAQKTQ